MRSQRGSHSFLSYKTKFATLNKEGYSKNKSDPRGIAQMYYLQDLTLYVGQRDRSTLHS